MPNALLLDEDARGEVEGRHANLEVEVSADHAESQSREQMICRPFEVVKIDGSLLPHDRVVVDTGSHVLIGDRVVVDLLPSDTVRVDASSWQKLTLLNLNVNDLVLLLHLDSGDDPKHKGILAIATNRAIAVLSVASLLSTADSLVVVDVGGDVAQIEIAIRAGIVIVAVAEAIAAVPEQPAPPAVDFGGASAASALLLAEGLSVLVLDVLVAAGATSVLQSCRKRAQLRGRRVF